MLNDRYWSERYEKSQTGWDVGNVSPSLKEYFDQLTDKSVSILIPGCGNAFEAEYLLQQGFTDITLIDISGVLVQNLQEKLKNFTVSPGFPLWGKLLIVAAILLMIFYLIKYHE